MSTIKVLKVNNYIGVSEVGMNPDKINIFKGPKGSGKSSILEAIDKIFTNKNRRTEVIKYGTDEATLYVELSDKLEIDRRIRADKSDYLKCRRENETVPSTEKFLRSLVNGEIFNPVAWVGKSTGEQTKSILAMLQIDWNMDNIVKWFGEQPSNIDFNLHILQILKAIETRYFKIREESNREIKELKTQAAVIVKSLPADYDGEIWRDKRVQGYYNAVSEAQKTNTWIANAKTLRESIQTKLDTIEATAERDKSKVQIKFKDQGQDIKDIIELSRSKILKANQTIEGLGAEITQTLRDIDLSNIENKRIAENELQIKIELLKSEYTDRFAIIDKDLLIKKEDVKIKVESEKENTKELINILENKIATKYQELLSLKDIEKQELINIENLKLATIEKENARVEKAGEYLKESETIDIEPLQTAADEVADMQSYMRSWDTLLDIRDVRLAEKCRYSALLTERIEKARTLPSDLLKVAKMPIAGISVDEKGLIRINNTLIDGLSDGEKLELAMTIAREQCGDLKVICVDRWESLNTAAQDKLLEEMKNDDYQYFVSSTNSDTFEIEKIGSGVKELPENVESLNNEVSSDNTSLENCEDENIPY